MQLECKKYGIKANTKNIVMREELKKVYEKRQVSISSETNTKKAEEEEEERGKMIDMTVVKTPLKDRTNENNDTMTSSSSIKMKPIERTEEEEKETLICPIEETEDGRQILPSMNATPMPKTTTTSSFDENEEEEEEEEETPSTYNRIDALIDSLEELNFVDDTKEKVKCAMSGIVIEAKISTVMKHLHSDTFERAKERFESHVDQIEPASVHKKITFRGKRKVFRTPETERTTYNVHWTMDDYE